VALRDAGADPLEAERRPRYYSSGS